MNLVPGTIHFDSACHPIDLLSHRQGLGDSIKQRYMIVRFSGYILGGGFGIFLPSFDVCCRFSTSNREY
jgi:hypothetical protein